MKPRNLRCLFICILLLHLFCDNLFALEQPECNEIESWARSYTPNQNFSVRDNIQLNTIFKDDVIVPLFKKPVIDWQKNDIKELQSYLAACRKQALKEKNREAGDQLYAVLKEVKSSKKTIR